MSKKHSTIHEELLHLLDSALEGEVKVSRPVFDEQTGCYHDILCRCRELSGIIVLKDGVNGEFNPCVYPVNQMSATELLGLLKDTVAAGRESLVSDYDGFVGKVEICDWAADAVRHLHLAKRIEALDSRKVACRHIYERLSLLCQWASWEKDRIPRMDFTDAKGELKVFRDQPYVLRLDTFAGLIAEGCETVRAVTVRESRNGQFIVDFETDGSGSLRGYVTREDIFLSRDHDWIPDESVLSLEELLNCLIRVDGFPSDPDLDLLPGENENNGLAVVKAVEWCGLKTSDVRYDTASDTLFLTLKGEETETGPRDIYIHQFLDQGYYTVDIDDGAAGPLHTGGMYDGDDEPCEEVRSCTTYLPSPSCWPWLGRIFETLDYAGYNPTHIEVKVVTD